MASRQQLDDQSGSPDTAAASADRTTALFDGMQCKLIAAESFAWCDGELDAHHLTAIAQHLEQCPSCHQLFIADAAFHLALRRAAQMDVAPTTLHDRIQKTFAIQALTTRGL
jgi:predicted anti-sigma-YlaC factor YlaD